MSQMISLLFATKISLPTPKSDKDHWPSDRGHIAGRRGGEDLTLPAPADGRTLTEAALLGGGQSWDLVDTVIVLK